MLATSACGASESSDSPPAAAAIRFAAALAAGDGDSACAVLAPKTLEELEQQEEMPCAEALPQMGLDLSTEVTWVEAFGGEALVRMGDEAVFVSEFSDGWRIVAAGCTGEGQEQYECEIKGA